MKRFGLNKWLIIIGLMIIIFAAGAFVVFSVLKDDRLPQEKVLDSMLKTLLSDGTQSETVISLSSIDIEGLEGPENRMLIMALEDLNLSLKVVRGIKEAVFSLQFSLNMRDIGIFHGTFYLDSELSAIDIPVLYSKPIYISHNDLQRLLMKEASMSIKDISFKELKERILSKDYDNYHLMSLGRYYQLVSAFIEESLVQEPVQEERSLSEKSYNGTVYQLAFNLDGLIGLLNNFSMDASQDEKLKQTLLDLGYVEALDQDKYTRVESIDLMLMSSLFVDQEEIVRDHEMTAALTLEEGFGDMLPNRIAAELKLESEILKLEDEVVFQQPDLSKAVNIGMMNDSELQAFYLEVKAYFNQELLNNQLFKLMGITSLEGLF